jgi:hypothetical protein
MSAVSPPRLSAAERAARSDRIFARLLEGQSTEAIATDEGVSARRVRKIVQEALERWDADPVQDYVGVQIARLESALRVIEQKIAEGDVKVVEKLVKVLGQLDKYHKSQLHMRETYIEHQDRDAALFNRLGRLAASRAVVAARLAGARAAALAPAAAAETQPAAPAESAERNQNAPQALENVQRAYLPQFFVTRNSRG